MNPVGSCASCRYFYRRAMVCFIFFLFVFQGAGAAFAQLQQTVLLRDAAPPTTSAIRAEPDAPDLDGVLDDAAWQAAPVIASFTQDYPDDGSPVSERTEVRVVYDSQALYVAARMFDSDPSGIVGRLGRRDTNTSSDRFVLSIDSYHDHRTAFRFGVNPAGIRDDMIATNDADSEDTSWDPVWEVVTRIDELGWVAEMRIPFSQLRFAAAENLTWGINFTRYIFRKAEWHVWSWWDNEEQGFASHFGHLEGLRGLTPPRRLEVLPYTVVKKGLTQGIRSTTAVFSQ